MIGRIGRLGRRGGNECAGGGDDGEEGRRVYCLFVSGESRYRECGVSGVDGESYGKVVSGVYGYAGASGFNKIGDVKMSTEFKKLEVGDTVRIVGEPVVYHKHFVGKNVGPIGCAKTEVDCPFCKVEFEMRKNREMGAKNE